MKKRLVVFAVTLLLALMSAFVVEAGPAPAKTAFHFYGTLTVLVAAVVLFFTEAIPLAVTAILVPCILSTLGVISVNEAWVGFGNTSILTIIGLFMLGEATFLTGFAQRSAAAIIRLAGTGKQRLFIMIFLLIGGMSAFLNNAGVTAMTLPMLVAVSREAGIAPSRLLMPTAFAASLGGTMTLVGTAPNMLANTMLAELAPGTRLFGFFEFGRIGLPLLLCATVLYLVVPRLLLPPERADTAGEANADLPPLTRETWLAGGIFILVFVAMSTEIVPLTSAVMLGAMLCVLTRCLTLKQAFKAVDWSTIFLFAGMLSMGSAMNKSGVANFAATSLVQVVSDPLVILCAVSLLTSVLTNIMSNTATTAVMMPLVLPVALKLGLSPLPFAMAIVVSASACFLTPIATPSNTLVLAAGNYTFLDYARYGWPLQVLAFILCVTGIPLIWPF